MTKSIFFRRIMIFVIGAIILSGGLILAIYSSTARLSFSRIKAQDMIPRAKTLATVTILYKESVIPEEDFRNTLASSQDIVVVYDYSKNQFILSQLPDDNFTNNVVPVLTSYLETIMSDQQVIIPGGISTSPDYIMVGIPVKDDIGTFYGAVFLLNPLTEVGAALNSLIESLSLAMGIVILSVLPFIVLFSNYLSRPLRQMRDIAIAMAGGNFAVRAKESGGEIGELGQSLNYLSATLERTISELRMERNRLLQMLDGLKEGIVAIDVHFNITHANPAVVSLFQIQHIKGNNFLDVLPDETIRQHFADAINEDTPQTCNVSRGNIIIRASITPLHDGEGHMAGAVGLFSDVTESERLEQTRRDYVANVSHELRTPLTSIRGFVEPLKDGLIKDEPTRMRYYGYILREAMRLSRLINDLLELSRLQSSQTAFVSRPFHLSEVLMNTAQRYYSLADDSGITLIVNSAVEHCPDAIGNPDRVEQVLIILLDNAIKFTSDSGTVELGVTVEESLIRVWVQDSGEGIQPDDLPYVFDRFYKADRSHSETGTGLGLSIAREIMSKMGQTIYAENTELGARFTFTLALSSDSLPAALPPETETEPPKESE